MEFEVKPRVTDIGRRKGQALFRAPAKSRRITGKMAVDRIVRETPLPAVQMS